MMDNRTINVEAAISLLLDHFQGLRNELVFSPKASEAIRLLHELMQINEDIEKIKK